MRSFLFKLLIKGTRNFFVQFFRYVFVGGLAFLVDTSFFFGLSIFLELITGTTRYYLVASALGFLVGIAVNYVLSKLWIFGEGKKGNIKNFILFTFVGLVGLALNQIFIFIFFEFVFSPLQFNFKIGNTQFYLLASKFFAAIIVLIWNFLARRRIFLE